MIQSQGGMPVRRKCRVRAINPSEVIYLNIANFSKCKFFKAELI